MARAVLWLDGGEPRGRDDDRRDGSADAAGGGDTALFVPPALAATIALRLCRATAALEATAPFTEASTVCRSDMGASGRDRGLTTDDTDLRICCRW